jgi:ATP-dependent Clp protease ATP-binding subunit ClpC
MNGYNFTDQVRRALQQAREQATALRREHVAPEHLLLGILHECDGVLAATLNDLAVEPDQLLRTVQASVTVGQHDPGPGPPDLPYTSTAKKSLEFAMQEARELGHSYVGTEHLLLGLLHLEAVPAVAEIAKLGVTLPRAREACQRRAGTAPGGLVPTQRGTTPWLVPYPASRTLIRLAFLLAVLAVLIALAALVVALQAT